MHQAARNLTIDLRPSRRLSALLLAAHAIAAAAVVLAAVPYWLVAMLLLPILASLPYSLRCTPPVRLVLRGDGRIEEVGADGTATEGDVLDGTLVTSALVVLCHTAGGRRQHVLLADSFPVADDFRRLRLWLRWRRRAADRDDRPLAAD